MLRAIGYDVVMTRSTGLLNLRFRRANTSTTDTDPPAMSQDFSEVLHARRGGARIAYNCPIDLCVNANGFNFSRTGWHPFSAALDEYASGRSTTYEGSLLERYYEIWQPQDAAEALLDPNVAPRTFKGLPTHMMYHFPWSARTLEAADRAIRGWYSDDGIEHGAPEVGDIDANGLKDHGPVSAATGGLEFKRLVEIYERIRREGFRREYGDVRVVPVGRGSELRFLNFGGGLHRTAAMKALGHAFVPATPLGPFVFHVDEVDYWPQVRAGVWDAASARRYVDHLFEFDALHWATERGLT
jgi:hypothetical protein